MIIVASVLLPLLRGYEAGPQESPRGPRSYVVSRRDQAVNELPQPQPPEELGFLNVNPEPIMVVT